MLTRKTKASLFLVVLGLYYASAAAAPFAQTFAFGLAAPDASSQGSILSSESSSEHACAHCGLGCTDSEHSCHDSSPTPPLGAYFSPCSGIPGDSTFTQQLPDQLKGLRVDNLTLPLLFERESLRTAAGFRYDLHLAPPSPPPQ